MTSLDHLSRARQDLLDAACSMSERALGRSLNPDEIAEIAEEAVELLPE